MLFPMKFFSSYFKSILIYMKENQSQILLQNQSFHFSFLLTNRMSFAFLFNQLLFVFLGKPSSVTFHVISYLCIRFPHCPHLDFFSPTPPSALNSYPFSITYFFSHYLNRLYYFLALGYGVCFRNPF